jgi:plasmid stabilization system protein ParE
MRRIDPDKIRTERELQLALVDLERRWSWTSSLEKPRARAKEVLKLRVEVKNLLNTFSRLKRSANFHDNDSNLFGKMLKIINRWIVVVERKYSNE